MEIQLKLHRLVDENASDDSGEFTVFKHHMTVVLSGGETNIFITRNECTGDIRHYYVDANGHESEAHDDERFSVAQWMEEVTGQPLDEYDGWDALPRT